jgi:hypothetical protein
MSAGVKYKRMRVALVCCVAVLAVGAVVWAERLEDTFYVPLDDAAIQYAGPVSDPIAKLEKQLESGKAKLDYAPNGWGYLPAVLKELGINIDSQVLVFSRTSIQTSHISPRTPRAIYFNDDVAVGFVQNGEVLELSAIDPKQGAVFYSLDTEKADRPEFARRDDCLRCHQGAPTMGIPGLMVSSVHPITDAEGRESHGSAFITDGRTSFAERWGGWYVTGTHGSAVHLGNNPPGVERGNAEPHQPRRLFQYVPVPRTRERYRRADDPGAPDAYDQSDDAHRLGRANRTARGQRHGGSGGARSDQYGNRRNGRLYAFRG